MLWKRVSTSRKVNRLSLKAAILWTWSQPHLDVEGFIEAEADYLKVTVVPMRKDIPEEEIPELVQDGISGFLVPECDVDALKEKLKQLILQPELRSRMGRAGRKYVEKYFNAKKLNDELVKLYEELLA